MDSGKEQNGLSEVNEEKIRSFFSDFEPRLFAFKIAGVYRAHFQERTHANFIEILVLETTY